MLNNATAHRKLSTSSGRLPAPKARPEVTQLIPMAGRSGKLSPVRGSPKGEQSCPAEAMQDAQGYLRPLSLIRARFSFNRATAFTIARATSRISLERLAILIYMSDIPLSLVMLSRDV